MSVATSHPQFADAVVMIRAPREDGSRKKSGTMTYIVLSIGILLFIVAGIQHWPALALFATFLSIGAILLGGRPAPRWVRIHTFIRREQQPHWQHCWPSLTYTRKRRARKRSTPSVQKKEKTSDDFTL
jgi:hypothetical protein